MANNVIDQIREDVSTIREKIEIPNKLGKIQKQLILNIEPNKKNNSDVFGSIVKFMEFRNFSLTDSVRPTYAVFKRKKGIFSNDKIKFRLKDLDDQIYVLVGSNMNSESEKEQFNDEMDALRQFIDNKLKNKK